MDVVAPPPQTPQVADQAEAPSQPAAQPAKTADLKPAKSRNGVGLAIFATVIIVLGLGALTVFAYLKQTGSL
jgi:hypothetical protein